MTFSDITTVALTSVLKFDYENECVSHRLANSNRPKPIYVDRPSNVEFKSILILLVVSYIYSLQRCNQVSVAFLQN